MTKLTPQQRSELIEQFVELQVDGMDWKTLAAWVTEEMTYNFEKNFTDDELREEIDTYDEDLYDELVDNVTNETVLDINDTGGKY